jgi:hypothetical protein
VKARDRLRPHEHCAQAFLARARHPRFGRGYPDLLYGPMRELVGLLDELEFAVYLCSDSSRDFKRVLAGPAYGLTRDRVIGSEADVELRDGRLVRTGSPVPLDDGPGKTVHVWDRTGHLPLPASGNAAGDIAMLTAARFALLIGHDDPDREYSYPDPAALVAAGPGGWTVVSMRADSTGCGSPIPTASPGEPELAGYRRYERGVAGPARGPGRGTARTPTTLGAGTSSTCPRNGGGCSPNCWAPSSS